MEEVDAQARASGLPGAVPIRYDNTLGADDYSVSAHLASECPFGATPPEA